MKIRTMINRFTSLVDAGVLPLAKKIAEDPDAKEKTVADLEVVLNCLLEARKRLEEVEADLEDTKVSKRYNRLSMRVWERDNYTCVVCGMCDRSCHNLSRAALLNDPKSDDDYITLCKEHMKAFKKVLPWKDRVNVRVVADALSSLENEFEHVSVTVP